jgi:hypothetical protein
LSPKPGLQPDRGERLVAKANLHLFEPRAGLS